MDIEKNTDQSEVRDPEAYGGCHYRLSYDKYQGIVAKTQEKRSRLAVVLLVIVVFVLLGFFIMRYYEQAVGRIFSDSATTTRSASANFQSYDGHESIAE